jgi:hypothetical protein
MSQTELRMWRERAAHADRVWKDHGLAKGAYDESVLDYIAAYRNEQWKGGLGDIPRDQCVTINMVFSVTNTLMATLHARHPVVDVYAENPRSRDNAPVMERALNFLIRQRQLRWKREINRALRSSLLLPGGLVRHVYVPQLEVFDRDGVRIETYDPTKPDFPAVRAWKLWDFRFDPLAGTFDPDGDGDWCAFRSLHTMDQIERNPNLRKRKDLRPTVSIEALDLRSRAMHMLESPETPMLVELWTYYVKSERKWFALSPGCDQPVRDPDDWPVDWPHLPFNFLGFNEQEDDPFPVAFPKVYYDLQMERNKVRTMMAELVKRMRRVIMLFEDGISEADREKVFDGSLAEFIRTVMDPRQVMHEATLGGLDQSLLLYDAKIEDDIRKILGVGDMNRAQRINVESATEAGEVAAGQSLQTGRNQGPFEDFVSDVIATFATVLQQSATQRFVVPILGESDAARLLARSAASPFLDVGPESISGDFVYEVRPGSMLPRDPNAEKKEAVSLVQALKVFMPDAVNMPQLQVDVLRAWDRDPARYLPQAVPTPGGADLGSAQERLSALRGLPPGAERQPQRVDADVASLIASTSTGSSTGTVQ